MLLACGAEVSVNPFEHQLMLRWHKEGKSTAKDRGALAARARYSSVSAMLQDVVSVCVCGECDLISYGRLLVSNGSPNGSRENSAILSVVCVCNSNGSPMEAPMEAEKTRRS